MRRKIVAGNWKMNLDLSEARKLFNDVQQLKSSVDVYVFPSAGFVTEFAANQTNVSVGAQNGYHKDSGAYTGEMSMKQWASCGAKAVLIGHSERREYFNETSAVLKEKVDAALSNGLIPFFCCGEPLPIREARTYLDFVKRQLEKSLFHLTEEQFGKCVIAYEPIWAIGTGLTASTEQAEEMHAAIRSWIREQYSEETANNCSILYGGSCNPSNAEALFACPNVDGGLIGGASLKAEDFAVLIDPATWNM